MGRGSGRLVVVLAALAASAAGCGGASPAEGACRLTVDVFPVPAAGVRPHVPPGLDLARYPGGRAAVDLWVLDCRRFPLPGADGPGVLALLGAVVVPPAGQGTLTPRVFEHHLLWAHADRAPVAAALRRAGLPVTVVPGLRVAEEGGERRTTVPWRRSAYAVVSPLGTREDRAHDHRNLWRRGRVRLVLRARGAVDRYCTKERCGTITADGGPLADVLGARRRAAHTSLDHAPLDPELLVGG